MRVACISGISTSVLIASQQKAQLHVFGHNSTRTRRGKSVNKPVGSTISDQTYNFAIFITSIYSLRHGKNTCDGRDLDVRLAARGLNMHQSFDELKMPSTIAKCDK
jgi:hypothetical protein